MVEFEDGAANAAVEDEDVRTVAEDGHGDVILFEELQDLADFFGGGREQQVVSRAANLEGRMELHRLVEKELGGLEERLEGFDECWIFFGHD